MSGFFRISKTQKEVLKVLFLTDFREESLVAAISEKDAHIALLETSNMKNPDEIETLRKHKEKLIKKLKEENVRRVKLFNEQNDTGDFASLPLMKDLKSSPADQVNNSKLN